MNQNTPTSSKKSSTQTLFNDVPHLAQWTGAAVSALLVWLLLSGGTTLNQPIPSGKPATTAPTSAPAEKPKAATVALAAMNLTASNAQKSLHDQRQRPERSNQNEY